MRAHALSRLRLDTVHACELLERGRLLADQSGESVSVAHSTAPDVDRDATAFGNAVLLPQPPDFHDQLLEAGHATLDIGRRPARVRLRPARHDQVLRSLLVSGPRQP